MKAILAIVAATLIPAVCFAHRDFSRIGANVGYGNSPQVITIKTSGSTYTNAVVLAANSKEVVIAVKGVERTIPRMFIAPEISKQIRNRERSK